MPPLTCGVLFLAIDMSFRLITAVADQCSGGSNIFTEIPENSPYGTLVCRLMVSGDPEGDAVQLTLGGIDADWFYLDGKAVRLNVSEEKVLDREALETPVLMVSFTCTEDGFSPAEYRIIVQVMNENDNKPRFQEDTILTQNISELAAPHSVIFSTQAEDADGDTLMYVIDGTSADAKYFRIDLPNSGRIVLGKALDFETKRHLEFVIHAVEMNTKERYNSSARIHVNVMDGDDQYPQFLPCNFLSHDGVGVCVSPVYTANITEGEVKVVYLLQTEPLQFLPGPIHAEDGDRDLKAAITYSILSGTDHGYFHMDNVTGAITMLRPVESRIQTPVYSLSVMASQVNDAKKYAVTEVRVRILAANSHAPHFEKSLHQAFVHEGESTASLVLTYGRRVLFVLATDMDFPDGFNPAVRYSLRRQSNHTQLFQVTPGGLLIARADHLSALQRYALQILARDEESGETANTTVNVEVLSPGQAVPLDPLEAGHQGTMDAGILAGGLGALLLVTAIILFLILRAMKKRQRRQQNMERAALAMEKHPNVVNAGKASPHPDNVYFQNEGYSDLGDEAPKTYGGQAALNSKLDSARSGKGLPVGDAPLANSVPKGGGQARASAAPKKPEEEEEAKTALVNGKALEQRPSLCLEDEALPKAAEQPVEMRVVEDEDEEDEEDEATLFPVGSEENQFGDTIGGPEEEQRSEGGPQQGGESVPEGKLAANGGPSHVEPAPQSPTADRNCEGGRGAGEHPGSPSESMDASQVVPCGTSAPGDTEPSDTTPAPKEPVPPLPRLEKLPTEDEEEDDGEETPKATSPTYRDPLAPLPVSDVRMPATLLQLLEDSIEC
ncbi:cadherin-related family member 5-like [Podarcis lilfordi]|uniref:Cadherin-related family member 5-like n=1 Tax=Podarcis lilfordi TaxID=74358 RepID=A0AA35PJ41_9SAUR|nr:cadherin-related family member 5-like [Podarcis lilfordi]